eukprot:30935-Pelagococcus_subviridis.AAC.6
MFRFMIVSQLPMSLVNVARDTTAHTSTSLTARTVAALIPGDVSLHLHVALARVDAFACLLRFVFGFGFVFVFVFARRAAHLVDGGAAASSRQRHHRRRLSSLDDVKRVAVLALRHHRVSSRERLRLDRVRDSRALRRRQRAQHGNALEEPLSGLPRALRRDARDVAERLAVERPQATRRARRHRRRPAVGASVVGQSKAVAVETDAPRRVVHERELAETGAGFEDLHRRRGVARDFSSHGGVRHAVRDDVEVISLVALLDDDRARGVRHLERGVHELLERRGV